MQENKWLKNEVLLYNKQHGSNVSYDKLMTIEETFENQGHSGTSAKYVINFLINYAKQPFATIERLDKVLEETRLSGDKNAYNMQVVITDNIKEIIQVTNKLNMTKEEIGLVPLLLDTIPFTPLTGEDDEWYEKDDVFKHPDICANEYTNKRCSKVSKYVFSNGLVICTALDDIVYSDNGGVCFFSTGRFGRKQITFPYTVNQKPEVVYLYEPSENFCPFILTDAKTIKQLKEIYLSNRDGGTKDENK